MWGLVFAGFFVLYLIYWYIHSKQYPPNFPPGPRHFVPFIGDPLFAVGQDTTAGFDLMHKKYGKIVGFNFGGQKFVSISDLNILQQVKITFLLLIFSLFQLVQIFCKTVLIRKLIYIIEMLSNSKRESIFYFLLKSLELVVSECYTLLFLLRGILKINNFLMVNFKYCIYSLMSCITKIFLIIPEICPKYIFSNTHLNHYRATKHPKMKEKSILKITMFDQLISRIEFFLNNLSTYIVIDFLSTDFFTGRIFGSSSSRGDLITP
jgi:hypothetical protein